MVHNYKEAYEILNLNPQTASLKEVFKNSKSPKGTICLSGAPEAADFLRKNSPEKDDLYNSDLIRAFKNKKLEWNEYYEEFHIYFEQKIADIKNKKLLNIFSTIFFSIVGTGATVLSVYNIDHAANKELHMIFICTILVSTYFACRASSLFFKLSEEQKSEIIKIFDDQRKINELNKQINKIKSK